MTKQLEETGLYMVDALKTAQGQESPEATPTFDDLLRQAIAPLLAPLIQRIEELERAGRTYGLPVRSTSWIECGDRELSLSQEQLDQIKKNLEFQNALVANDGRLPQA